MLANLPESYREADSVILVENYDSKNPRYSLFGKAVFRIGWLLGGRWRLMGWISFLPAFLYDWAYRLVAHNRRRLFSDTCTTPSTKFKERFLK